MEKLLAVCGIKGCERKVRALGLCSVHYARAKEGKDMTAPVREVYRAGGGDQARLMSKVKVDPDTGCWNWRASKTEHGYGQFRFRGTRVLAHRAAWVIFNGDIPADDNAYQTTGVLHKCDNPACVNPEHLFLGNQTANTVDSVTKGRWGKRGCPGESHGKAILTEKQVLEIRASTDSLDKLAERYGVTRSAVAHIRYRRSWKHLQ